MNNEYIVSGIVLAGIISALILIPVFAPDTTIFLVNGNNGTPTPCSGNTGLVLAQNLTDLCDVTIISPTTNQIIRYNGSQWVNVNSSVIAESTACHNLGAGIILCAGDNVNVRTLIAGLGISISNDSNTVTITNTSPESTVCANVGGFSQVYKDGNCNFRTIKGSPDISVIQNANDIAIDYNGTLASESTVCTNDGHGNGNVCNGGNVHLKGVASGTSISVSQNGTDVIITNSSPEDTVCTNLGSSSSLSEGICNGGNVSLKRLLEGSNIALSSNSTHITIAVTGITSENTVCNNLGTGTIILNVNQACASAKSLKAGTGLSIANTTNDITYTNTGVISNSCSAGITCSGTNPSAFTVKWELLCQTVLGSSNSTISCNGFSARTNLIIDMSLISNGGTGVEPAIRFNGDTGSNYAVRTSANGGADATILSTTRCNLGSNGGLSPSTDTVKSMMYFDNFSASRKIGYGNKVIGSDTTVATAPMRAEIACKWGNTSAQITSITVISFSGTGNYNTNSVLTVWGYN